VIYVRMAVRSLMQSRGLTAVMIAALSLGIGTWYVQHQIFAHLDHKTPDAPDALYLVGLDRSDAVDPHMEVPLVPSIMMTLGDARGVLGDGRGTVTFSAPALVEPDALPAERVQVRYATRDLFSLFAIPLADGAPWSVEADRSPVPLDEGVIDEALARRMFGDASAIDRRLRIDGRDVRIVGVVAASHAARYHLYERFVPGLDAVYLPLAHATAAHARAAFAYTREREAAFATAWVRLPTARSRAAFVDAATAYLARSGRDVPRTVVLHSAEDWRAVFVPAGTISLWPVLSTMCLGAAVLNLIRMLIAKFSGRSHELGLMRALGARRRAVMGQLLLEAMLIGIGASACGLVIGIAMMPLAAHTIEATAGTPPLIGGGAIVATFAASIGAALVAAVYPAWRLSRGTPAAQMRPS
jgi:putative ABC transport system permease protein